MKRTLIRGSKPNQGGFATEHTVFDVRKVCHKEDVAEVSHTVETNSNSHRKGLKQRERVSEDTEAVSSRRKEKQKQWQPEEEEKCGSARLIQKKRRWLKKEEGQRAQPLKLELPRRNETQRRV